MSRVESDAPFQLYSLKSTQFKLCFCCNLCEQVRKETDGEFPVVSITGSVIWKQTTTGNLISSHRIASARRLSAETLREDDEMLQLCHSQGVSTERPRVLSSLPRSSPGRPILALCPTGESGPIKDGSNSILRGSRCRCVFWDASSFGSSGSAASRGNK